MKNIIPIIVVLLAIHLSLPLLLAAQPPEERSVEIRTDPEKPKDTIVDVLIGTTPPMPTENGLLILRAYYDKDNNGKRGELDQELDNLLICEIDAIKYSLPAFIPGLMYNKNYSITCSGEDFMPSRPIPEVFIAKHGQIIKMDLPCRPYTPPSITEPSASPPQ